MKLLILLVPILLFAGCKNLPYSDDNYYTSSREAFSPEYMVYPMGKLCKDNDGIIGFCAIRIKRDKDFYVEIPAQQYSYEGDFSCSSNVQQYPDKVNVLEGESYKFVLPRTQYIMEKVFNCSIQITPMDRPEPIAAFARMSVVVVDANYIELETPVVYNSYFVLGQHARYVYWMDKKNKWHWSNKLTHLKKKDVRAAFVESHNMRFSSWGL